MHKNIVALEEGVDLNMNENKIMKVIDLAVNGKK